MVIGRALVGMFVPTLPREVLADVTLKSHIQTHLKERQCRCMDSSKSFAPQHNLRRHANEVQPYPCPFGKGFALLDALSRLVRRGKGIGASGGTTKTANSAPMLDLPVEVLQQILGYLATRDSRTNPRYLSPHPPRFLLSR